MCHCIGHILNGLAEGFEAKQALITSALGDRAPPTPAPKKAERLTPQVVALQRENKQLRINLANARDDMKNAKDPIPPSFQPGPALWVVVVVKTAETPYAYGSMPEQHTIPKGSVTGVVALTTVNR